MMTTLTRYVYVYLEGRPRVMSICELEVYGHNGSYPIRYIAIIIIPVA